MLRNYLIPFFEKGNPSSIFQLFTMLCFYSKKSKQDGFSLEFQTISNQLPTNYQHYKNKYLLFNIIQFALPKG
jgi:hypothetical protein